MDLIPNLVVKVRASSPWTPSTMTTPSQKVSRVREASTIKPWVAKPNYVEETRYENMFMRHNGKGKWTSNPNMSPKQFTGMLQQQQGADLPTVSPSTLGDHDGMVDCGATTSPAPETSVQGLIQPLLVQDRSATH